MTTAHEVRTFTRNPDSYLNVRHSSRRTRTPGDLYLYGAFIVLAVVEAVGIVSAPGHSAAVLGGRATAEWFLAASDSTGVCAALLLTLFAILFAFARRLGPIVMTRAQVHWWLPLPIDRRGLVLPGYLASLLVPVCVLAVATAVVFTGVGGFSDGVVGAVGVLVLTMVAVVSLTALTHSAAMWIQHRQGQHRHKPRGMRVSRIDSVVRVLPTLMLTLVLGATQFRATMIGATGMSTPLLEWFVWLPTGWPLLVAGGAVWPVAVLAPIAVLASWLAYRTVPSLTTFSLSRSSDAGSLASEALLSMEFTGMTGGHAEERAPHVGSLGRTGTRPRRSPATGPARRFIVTQFTLWWRQPGQALSILSASLLPVAILAVPYLNLTAVLVAVLVVCTLRAVTIAGSAARVMAERPALGRLFPLGDGTQRQLMSVLPTALLVPWCVLCFGLLIAAGAAPASSAWFAIPVGLGLAGAAVRTGYRPDTDWETPLISTPMGAVSSGWVMNALHGRTATIVVLYPALLAIAGGSVTLLLVLLQCAISAAAWWWCTRQNRGMALWKSNSGDSDLPKNDRGSGSLNDYAYDLIPRSRKTVIRLANCDVRQEELQRLLDEGASDLETAGGRRTSEEERTDAAMEVRLFTGGRVSGVVGVVPRGLESAIDEAMTRLERAGKKARIPAAVVNTRHGLRVELLMGATKSP